MIFFRQTFGENVLNIKPLSLIILLLVSVDINARNVHFQIEGLSGALKKNVHAQLSIIDRDQVTLDHRFYERVDSAIRKGLKALGYYEPIISLDFRLPHDGGRQVLVAHVSPGKPVLIGGTTVILRGKACTDQDYLNLLKTCPKVGTVLNHGDYEHFKTNLINVALRKGYFDSQFTKNNLGITMERHQAFWEIDFDSGERYRFGDITFEGSKIRDEYLQNLIPFKKGDYYQFSDLGELNRRLSATGWFNSVVLVPEFNKASKTKMIPLLGKVSTRTANTIETGIGYSTDLGPHVKVIWKKPWINSYSHNLTTSSSISAIEQKLNFSYKIPLLKNPLGQYYLVQAGFKRTDLNNTEQNSTTLSVSRHWDLPSGWQRAINLRWNFDHCMAGNVANTTMLMYPSIMISRTRSQGGLIPMWGDSQRYSIDYSNSSLGSGVDFSVIQAKNIWIRTLYGKHRFIIHGNLGWIEARNFKRVPPDLRFFAGGNHSIRGYKYKFISPENEKSQLTGGFKLITGSLEYQFNVKRKWWGAMFIDGSKAVSGIRKSNFKSGTGIGVRWESPLGAIKLDFAIPVSNKDNSQGVQFYISLGPEL